MNRLRLVVRLVAWACVLAIAAVAFYVSWHAIAGVWVRIGAGRPQDAWAAPILVDGLILVASLVALSRSLDGVGGGGFAYAIGLVALGAGVSFAANVAHAAPHAGARALAAMVPRVRLLVVELAIGEALRIMRREVREPAPADGTLGTQVTQP